MALQQSGDCQSDSAGGENGDGINKARHNKKTITSQRKTGNPGFLFFAPAIVNLLVNSKIDSAEHTALRSEMKNKSSDSRLTMNPAQSAKKADLAAF